MRSYSIVVAFLLALAVFGSASAAPGDSHGIDLGSDALSFEGATLPPSNSVTAQAAGISVIDLPEDQWVLTFAPYAWLLALDGDLKVGNSSADVDISFSDILEDLSWVLEGRLEARRNDWGFWADQTIGKIETDDTVSGVSLDTTTDLKLSAFMLSHAIYRGPYGAGDDRRLLLEATAGFIITSIDSELKVGAPLRVKNSLKEDWVDLSAGLRGTAEVSERGMAQLTAIAGGFDIGDSSDLTVWLEPMYGYDVGDPGWWTLWAGYRCLWIDYKRSSFEFDVLIHGPVIGAAVTF